jgi:hypothetical protein
MKVKVGYLVLADLRCPCLLSLHTPLRRWRTHTFAYLLCWGTRINQVIAVRGSLILLATTVVTAEGPKHWHFFRGYVLQSSRM